MLEAVKMEVELEKVKILLSHWIHHNAEHKTEFENWAEKIRNFGLDNAYAEVNQAAVMMDKVNEHLSNALTAIGD